MKFNKDRSTNYRNVFFSTNKPFIKNKYFCAYCGKLVDKKNITIDHLYPIDAVKKSFFQRLKLKLKGFNDINDVRNLVPACFYCNQQKSNKQGIWIIKGKIGKYQTLWVVRKIIRVCLIIVILLVILNKDIREIIISYVNAGKNNTFYNISNNHIINQMVNLIP